MRGVAEKEDAPEAEALQPPAAEGVDGNPLDIERRPGSDHGADAGHYPIKLRFFLGVGFGPELKIDAPDIVGLLVKQRRAARVKRRVEPEAPFRREFRFHPDIGDQETVRKGLPAERKLQAAAHGGAHTVAGQQPVAGEGVAAGRRRDLNADAAALLLDPGEPRLPAQVQTERPGALRQIFLDIILLDVDERGPAVPFFGQQVESIDEFVAVEDLAAVPDHALGGQFGADAEARENLQGSLGEADEPRAGAYRVVLVHQHDIDAPEFQVDGGGQPDRPRADDADGVMPFASVEIGRLPEGIDRVRAARLQGCLHGLIIAAPPQPGQTCALPARGALYSRECPYRRGANPQWRAFAISCLS